MLQWKCVDAQHSSERTPSGPMKGATGSKVKKFRAVGIEICNKMVVFTSVKLTNCSQPLCCKAFSGNAISRQQQWANSVQKLPSNHIWPHWSAASKQLLCEISVAFGTEVTLFLHISILARRNIFTLHEWLSSVSQGNGDVTPQSTVRQFYRGKYHLFICVVCGIF